MSSAYEHIVCCFEDSAPSRQALAEARRLRALGPGRLTVIHVAHQPAWWGMGSGYAVVLPDPLDDPDALRDWLVAETGEDDADHVVLTGYPAAAVCDWAAGHGVDLIVAAAHRGVIDRVLLGSFAGFLVRHAPCATLLVRPASGSARSTTSPEVVSTATRRPDPGA